MLIIIGLVVVFASILGGYSIVDGPVHMLLQPAEMIIIMGAAFGAFLISCTSFLLKLSIKGFLQAFSGKTPGKDDYLELLAVLNGLFSKMHREGVISIEKDIEQPESSPMFQRFPRIAKDKEVCAFIGDTLRIYLTTGNAGELDKLMHIDMEVMHEEKMLPIHTVTCAAESLPGMGIVAAVLGVVLTMGKINAPPDELGHAIGAALVGTFVGILMCYGVFAPISYKMGAIAAERDLFFRAVREAVAAAVRGSSPMVSMEFGRRAIPLSYRPTFQEMEQKLKG
ncbi:flagellar motor stator protein MotA [Desulfovibrio sp. OttesenSCG-928-I05]|nr:flagellar motor stator protein MotA [Desulfovibrio sp. OttesenSCG-928-I05]